MIVGIIILAMLAILLVLLVVWAYQAEELAALCIVIVIGLLIFGCNQTDMWQEHVKAEAVIDAAQAKADATPQPIRAVDGCTVYQFKDAEKWHYFTRCPTTTTTERHYNESCGKNCTKDKSETITTENTK